MNQPVDRIAMRNVNSPGRETRVDAAKYAAMKQVMLAALPASQPGLSWADLKARVVPLLPDDLFPGGAKAGWWLKGVQLDLEARGLVGREASKPLRFFRR